MKYYSSTACNIIWNLSKRRSWSLGILPWTPSLHVVLREACPLKIGWFFGEKKLVHFTTSMNRHVTSVSLHIGSLNRHITYLNRVFFERKKLWSEIQKRQEGNQEGSPEKQDDLPNRTCSHSWNLWIRWPPRLNRNKAMRSNWRPRVQFEMQWIRWWAQLEVEMRGRPFSGKWWRQGGNCKWHVDHTLSPSQELQLMS